MIKANDIRYVYEGHDYEKEALKNLSIEVKSGEYLAIIGHNGSGKSTFAKLTNAILLPTEGEVLVLGMNTSNEEKLWDIRRTVGMVFQNPDNQLVATTVEEDVAFGPENLAVKREEIRERIDSSLQSVGMTDHKHKQPHMLSGGQKQRVAIAGILAMKPSCIVLDEPTAMLDPQGRREVISTIEKLNKEDGITIVNITHFMDEAIRADRVIVLESGKKVMEGTPKEVFRSIDTLREIGLDVPIVTQLAARLKKSGVNISDDILTIEEMVESLCQLL